AAEDAHASEKQPVWRRIHAELEGAGVGGGPVRLIEGSSARVLDWVVRHGLVLATGHLGRDEIVDVVDASVTVRARVVVTHPDYPTQDVPVDVQRQLAERGALLERCFAPIHTGKVSWEQTFAAIPATRPERNALS